MTGSNHPNFLKMDFDYGLSFFRIQPGVLIGLGDIEGFLGSEKETMEWISNQFYNDQKAIDSLSQGFDSLPNNTDNEMEASFDQTRRHKR